MKKLILLMVMFLCALSLFGDHLYDEYNGTTGATTDSVMVMQIQLDDFKDLGITITNTGTASNDLNFYVYGYMAKDENGSENYIKIAESSLADGENALIEQVPCVYSTIRVYIGSAASASPTTYNIQYSSKK